MDCCLAGMGGLITLAFAALAAVLAANELRMFLFLSPRNSMEVDALSRENIVLELDITLPRMPCSMVNLMHLEATAENPLDNVGHKVYKERLDTRGRKLGYEPERLWQQAGARKVMPSEAMILKDMREEFVTMADELKAREGCRVWGTVEAPRVSSALYLTAALHSDEALYRLQDAIAQADTTHTIHKLRFGPQVPGWRGAALEGVENVAKVPGSFGYFIQVVPTKFRGLMGTRREGFQYSVQEYFAPSSREPKTPSIMFEYEFYPIAVVVERAGGGGLLHFLVRLSAVVGGCFALAQATDYLAHLGGTIYEAWLH